MKALKQIHQSLQDLNGIETSLSIMDFVKPTKGLNKVIFQEENEVAEIAVCLNEKLLSRVEDTNLPEDFSLEKLPDLSVVVEELSHFNTYCEKALKDQPVSELELEVQAEVDKFGLALEWLSKRNEDHLKEQVFELLFKEITLGEWVLPDKRALYEDAHLIARNFCRKLMHEDLNHSERRDKFRKFFSKSQSEKFSFSS